MQNLHSLICLVLQRNQDGKCISAADHFKLSENTAYLMCSPPAACPAFWECNHGVWFVENVGRDCRRLKIRKFDSGFSVWCVHHRPSQSITDHHRRPDQLTPPSHLFDDAGIKKLLWMHELKIWKRTFRINSRAGKHTYATFQAWSSVGRKKYYANTTQIQTDTYEQIQIEKNIKYKNHILRHGRAPAFRLDAIGRRSAVVDGKIYFALYTNTNINENT